MLSIPFSRAASLLIDGRFHFLSGLSVHNVNHDGAYRRNFKRIPLLHLTLFGAFSSSPLILSKALSHKDCLAEALTRAFGLFSRAAQP
jgi:hypothetical protein